MPFGNQIPRASMLAAANQAGGTTSAICGVCSNTFRIPLDNLVIVRPPNQEIEWIIDIGGYCDHCRGYRCEQHVRARNTYDEEPGGPPIPVVELLCVQCGRRVGPKP